MNKNISLKRIVIMAVLCALSIVLVNFIRVPMFLPFLEYDPMDIPILFGALVFGPVSGIVMTVVTSIIQGITVSAQSGLYGILMHIAATGILVFTASIITRHKKTIGRLILAGIIAVLAMVSLMVCFNLLITPLFMKQPVSSVVNLLLPAIIPFNLVKGSINTALGIILYKSIYKYCKI